VNFTIFQHSTIKNNKFPPQFPFFFKFPPFENGLCSCKKKYNQNKTKQSRRQEPLHSLNQGWYFLVLHQCDKNAQENYALFDEENVVSFFSGIFPSCPSCFTHFSIHPLQLRFMKKKKTAMHIPRQQIPSDSLHNFAAQQKKWCKGAPPKHTVLKMTTICVVARGHLKVVVSTVRDR
jgi:hypothetical protein